MGVRIPAQVEGDHTGEDLGGPVLGIGMFERSHPPSRIVKPSGELGQLTFVAIVVASYGQCQPIPGRDDDGGEPDLDLQLVDLPGGEGLDQGMGVIGPVGQALLRVEGPVGGANHPGATGVLGSRAPMKVTS